MRFGIVGAGKMGAEIEDMASRRGHDVVWKLDSRENAGCAGLTPERLSQADVVFEFTNPVAAPANLTALAGSGATVVCGTTGWDRELPRLAARSMRRGALVHSLDFSVGEDFFYPRTRRGLYPPPLRVLPRR